MENDVLQEYTIDLGDIELCKIGTYQDYIYNDSDKWYLHKETKKVVLNGSENWTILNNCYRYESSSFEDLLSSQLDNMAISNEFTYWKNTGSIATLMPNLMFGWTATKTIINVRYDLITSIDNFKTYLSNNNMVIYYVLATPTNTEITDTTLIGQLDAINENAHTYKGKTYITSNGIEIDAPINIDYYTMTDFELWSLRNRNYGDFTLDAWDIINYQLENKNYLTLNNNTINYEMTIMTDVNTKIPTKQQEVTTNIVGGDDSVNIKKIKTEVDNLNGTATILAQQTQQNSSEIARLRVDFGSIQNLFTLTGGRNVIRNSAFLLQDEVWNFTNNGSNPYHTPFGSSYNVALAGKTVSISEIKLQDTIAKTNSDNIVGVKNDGTRYNLNFYYKQDADTTTTIKLYDTNNTSVKAFDDITITGAKDFTNYEISFVPTSTNYTLEIVTSTTANSGSFYLYDLMLNSGDRQPWSPASDEVYSTTLTMSRLGLKVYSVGDGTVTILGSDGLVSYETTDGQTLGQIVSQRTVDGDKTRSNTTQIHSLTSDITNGNAVKWIETTLELDGKLHRISYLETGE